MNETHSHKKPDHTAVGGVSDSIEKGSIEKNKGPLPLSEQQRIEGEVSDVLKNAQRYNKNNANIEISRYDPDYEWTADDYIKASYDPEYNDISDGNFHLKLSYGSKILFLEIQKDEEGNFSVTDYLLTRSKVKTKKETTILYTAAKKFMDDLYKENDTALWYETSTDSKKLAAWLIKVGKEIFRFGNLTINYKTNGSWTRLTEQEFLEQYDELDETKLDVGASVKYFSN